VSSSFAHLHVHSEFSMLDGAARIRDLVEGCVRMGMPALGLTDHGYLYGLPELYREARAAGITPVLGCELYVATRTRFDKSKAEKDGNHHMTAWAVTDTGYANLMKLASAASLEGFYMRPRVDRALLAAHAEGIVATSGCLGGEVSQLLLAGREDDAIRVAGEFQELFGRGNFFIELMDHGLEEQKVVTKGLLRVSEATGAPLVLTNDLHYTAGADAETHDVLLCIQTGAQVADEKRLRFGAPEFYLKSPEQMRALFPDHAVAADNTLAIAERANVTLSFGVERLPVFATPDGSDAATYLRAQTYAGAATRYGAELATEVRERIDYELGVIIEMGFPSYFLIVADLIRFARENGVRVGPGRGSAAGSVVSYCLGIVDLDPLRYGLLFERFLNLGRREMPDIDMDFDDRGRASVIEYAARRYGADRLAQISTFATIKGKQAIRDSARVLGLPFLVGDQLAKMYPPSILGKDAPLAACFDRSVVWPEDGTTNDAWSQAADLRKAYESDPDSKRVLDIARGLEGLKRQAGVHAAGVVMSDVPLTDVVPVWRNETGATITQYDMGTVAALGLLKMDFLGLRNLTVLADCLEHLRRADIDLDIDAVPLDDPKTLALLSSGDTIGLFQIGKNPGMRDLCKAMAPDSIDDVIALVALYRPGPLGAKMHLEYVERKHLRKAVTYPHPDLEPILAETYGIMVYQEQVMRIATDIAGFTLTDADKFRSAVGKKKADVMATQRAKFVAGVVANGYEEALGIELWGLIEFFAGYGFNKSHSACYGYVCYQTAYLKAHHRVAYMSALLENFKHNADDTIAFLAECRRMGLRVLPPDVNTSELGFAPDGEAIRYGLSAVKGLGEHVSERIIVARTTKGAFVSFEDFCTKVDAACLNKRVLEALAKAGAFDALGVPRAALLIPDLEKGLVLSPGAQQVADAAIAKARAEEAGQFSLFGEVETVSVATSELSVVVEIATADLLRAEKELLGAYVSDHPLLGLEPSLRDARDTPLAQLGAQPSGSSVTVAGLVSGYAKRFTRGGKPMASFVLEDLEGSVEVVVFPNAFDRVEATLANEAILIVRGRLEERGDGLNLIAAEVRRLDPNAANEPLVLDVPADAVTPPFVERLKEILGRYRGRTPVQIRMRSERGHKTLRLPASFAVSGTGELYAELKAFVGRDAIAERGSMAAGAS
jgi:DNA polymerase-3 subunit alpha